MSDAGTRVTPGRHWSSGGSLLHLHPVMHYVRARRAGLLLCQAGTSTNDASPRPTLVPKLSGTNHYTSRFGSLDLFRDDGRAPHVD
jgi:hypothetical protein